MKRAIFLILVIFLLQACSSTKYVPENKELLYRSNIRLSEPGISRSGLKAQMRQSPNHRFLGIAAIDLALYNLSGSDTTKWINRSLRKIGEAPVIYDSLQSQRTQRAMEQYLFNQGYFDAQVSLSEQHLSRRRVNTTYHVKANMPYQVASYAYQSQGNPLDSLLQASMDETLVKPGAVFSGDVLNAERSRLVSVARNQGYYAINRDHFSYEVDSTLGNHSVDVQLQLKPYTRMVTNQVRYEQHQAYRIKDVFFLMDVPNSSFSRTQNAFQLSDYDTLQVADHSYVVYRDEPFLTPRSLLQHCHIRPGTLYCAEDVSRTYAGLNQIECLKYVNIRFVDIPGDEPSLNAYILLSPSPYNALSLDVEGTNTAGDLGAALSAAYAHQNVFGGGQVLSANLRLAYEALAATVNNDYIEYGGELGLTFPELLLLPDASHSTSSSNTSFSISYDNLMRPEFWRTTAAVAMEYNWRSPQIRHSYSPIDFAYTHMPGDKIDSTFKANYLKEGSYLRHSYEDQFIVGTSYEVSYTSIPTGLDKTNRRYYSLRSRVESAGNLLYLGYRQFGQPDADGQYNIGKIPFSQYLKGEFEATHHVPISDNLRLASRFGFGIAYPYGNSKILPFEKRFYSGGANSVRGWLVRRLGPGSYQSSLGNDFMNRSGDMKLDLSLELRQKWFWLFEGAYFIDAGNIWTLRQYDNQPGGQFRFDSFYKELACSVGVGLRLDFNFFLLRLDCGMKVYDPSGQTLDERWRIKHIDSLDDFAVHLSIGYPF